MYCTQAKIGNPTKPILIIISGSLILTFMVLIVLYIQTQSAVSENNTTKQYTPVEFSIIEDSLFIGFIGNTPVVQKNNSSYKYNIEQRSYEPLIELPPQSIIQITDRYIVLTKDYTHASSKDIYNYYEQLTIYDSNGKLLYEISDEFSVTLLHDDKLFTIKFNEIQSFDQDISTIKTYSLSDNNYSLENEFTLPYEVVPKLINNIIFYQTVEYREQILYEVNENEIEVNEILSLDPLIISNELCFFLYEQEIPVIKCNEKTYSLDFSPVALYQDNDIIYLVKDSSTEGIKWYETQVGGIEEVVEVIELSIPFAPFDFECKEGICVLWNEETTLLINN